MEIRLLGSVELRLNGESVRTGPERVRRLLALLAWQPNEFVSDDVLIDRIWDDRVPQHPRSALYTCATRLRSVFAGVTEAGGCGGSVVRRGGGYLLTVPTDSVDLHRFRRLVRRAHEAARRSDPAEARQLLDHAVALWAEAPMADLRSGWAERARVALERERLAAVRERAGLGLRLGWCSGDVPSLYRLVEEHPLDEALVGLLMLALYRSGRQSEALSCYARMRRRTVECLGDEPGAPLRHLHDAVLRRDSTLVEAYSPPWLTSAA